MWNLVIVLIPLLPCFIIILLNSSVHLFHSNYKWKYNRPIAYILHRFYMRIEWAVMKVALKIGNSWLLRHSKFLRQLIKTILFRYTNGEVYTLKECHEILDSLYKDYPHVYVGMRICPCRQTRNIYDKHISNVTDLTFVFSKIPGTKKRMRYIKFISLEEAKKLLQKFDNEGFVHMMFGACARYVDGSLGLTLCNCKRGICVPMELKLECDCFEYNKPHNLAIVNQDKCKGVDECGKCIEYCYFDARMIDKNTGKIKVIDNNCYGCGLCISHCPQGANTLKFLPENRIYVYENLFKDIRQNAKKRKI